MLLIFFTMKPIFKKASFHHLETLFSYNIYSAAILCPNPYAIIKCIENLYTFLYSSP